MTDRQHGNATFCLHAGAQPDAVAGAPARLFRHAQGLVPERPA